MFRRDHLKGRAGNRWIVIRLLAFALLLGAPFSTHAATVFCSQFGGVVDGFDPATKSVIDSSTTFGIDQDCIIKNFPQSTGGLTITLANFNFPKQASYVVIFDNVYYTGNMSCNDPTHSTFFIWWVNGSFNNISPQCRTFFVPVDGINKQNPAGQTTATIGVPFTYTLTFPDMAVISSTGVPEFTGQPDTTDVSNVVITDDLTTTGAALSYVSNTAYLVSGGTRTPLGTLANTGDSKHLIFSYTANPALALIPAGSQIEIDLTVVLDNTPTNVAGTQFINTAHSSFDKIVNGIPATGLPGQDGITPPMTIVEPDLVVDKRSPVTSMNLGSTAPFTIDVQNNGGSDAWNTTIVDRLPRVTTGNIGGMCDAAPTGVTAAIYAADGVTLVSNLVLGTDFLLTWIGAPTCELSLTLLNTSAARIQPSQHLIITYQAKLDANTVVGATLTNVAGATQWFSAEGNGSYPGRREYDKTLTDGTPSVVDFQDSYTITVTQPPSTAPVFRVDKTAQDLSGDPNVLQAGDTLRYTITVKNVGNEDAINVMLRDLVPANATYVSNSTTLNGSPVPDPVAGGSPLQNGLSINTPGDPNGVVRADATGGTAATITFTVVVSSSVLDGVTICNQGFVDGAGQVSGPFPEKPSDDPATPVVDDPTCKVVGNLPLVYAQKTVRIQTDMGSLGIVDPGDVLRYTITIVNSAATPATGVVLNDAVPANTTYVANSVRLNGNPVSGVSPPVLQIPIGTLSAGGSAVVTFDVQVNAGVPTGTLISNQGSISTNELPTQLTDADGDPSNGYQPTVVVVGDAQQLTITKGVFVVGGGVAVAGGQLEYVVDVTNIGAVPATNVVITDDLGALSGLLTYVAGSATLNGSTNGVTFAGGVLTANYSAAYGDLAPGATIVLRFRADIAAGLPTGTSITNTARVTWNTPTQSASSTVSVSIGGVPGAAVLSGRVWHDANFNNALDTGEQMLAGWAVDLYRNGQRLLTVFTAADGTYQIGGVTPNAGTGDQYEIRFRAPGAGPNTAMLGLADSPFTNGLQRISGIVATSSSNVQNLNLPIDPDGVVYDSITRTPIAGATLTMLQASTKTPLPGTCFDDPVQQGQVTLAAGYYKFDLNFSDPSCPADADYLIQVTPPANFSATPSQVIPPTSSAATPAYSVPLCPNDAIPSTNYCEAQGSEFAPPTSVPPGSAGTRYYLHVTLNNGTVPQESQLFNNHIPIDPQLAGAVAITKTTPLFNVTRAGQVPYTITIRNTFAGALPNLAVVDTMPPGFKYVKGSSRVNGVAVEPTTNGRQLSWGNLTLATDQKQTIQLLLVVGSGVSDGEYVNSAQVIDTLGNASPVATATVRVVPEPTFDCTDVIGKVFDDANLNGYQDKNEKGLGGVRIVSARGLIAKTDEYGRFHITCAVIPNETLGTNFILKLDDRTLPTGYRLTTENPLVQRATRGKAIKFNFGAALHRVVHLDVADGVFEPDSTEVRPQWRARFDVLLDELRKSPSILRISYLADVEDQAIVKARLHAVKREVAKRWAKLNCCYRLTIETEIFWRRGGPPAKRTTGGR